MGALDVAVPIFEAVVVVVALWLLRRDEPVEADEGYLWYGTQRIVLGDVPLRDFRSYEPGRYVWCAPAVRLVPDRLSALRAATHAFWFCGVSVALVALRAAGIPLVATGLAALAIGAWAFPQYKLFEPAVTLVVFAAGFVFIGDPRPETALLGGAAVGLAALFGFNLFLYASTTMIVLALWVIVAADGPWTLALRVVVGTVVAASPLIIVLVCSPSFRRVFVHRRIVAVLRRGSSNLPTPLPLPWWPPTIALAAIGRRRRLAFGWLFVAVAVVPAAVLVFEAVIRVAPDDDPASAARLAAAATGLMWWHHAYSRADIRHLAQSMMPLVLLAVLAVDPGSWSILASGVAAAGSIALTAGELRPTFWWSTRRHVVRRAVGNGGSVPVRPDQDRLLDVVEALRSGRENVLAVPVLVWVYPVLGLRSPVYDTFCVYPASVDEQEQMLAEVRRADVDVAVVFDLALDGRDDLRFAATHPLVWYETARPDGRRVVVRASGRPIFEGGVFRGYRGATTDITAERQAEQKLRERDTEFANLFRHHPLPMWIHEPGTLRFLDVNDAMCTTYGYTREEFSRLTAMDLRTPEQQAALAELVASIPRDASYQAEREHVSKDGKRIDAIVNVAPIEFDGKPARFVMVRDVTQQRAAEARAAEAERTLRQNQQIEALAKLAGGMAHEFNNLLTVIISANEMLSDGLPEDGEGRQLASMALEAAQRGAQLADSLMTISRRQDLSVLRIDIGAVVRRMEEPLRRLLGGAIALEMDIAAGALLCELDEGQLEAAIVNLASNARDAMHDGGVVRVSATSREVASAEVLTDARLQPGSWVVVSMQDNGWGMSPAVVAKAFEPYFTTKPVGQGMGLGLSMVHGFVNQSGGFSIIDSRVGSGTTVSLFFPAVRTRREFAST